MSKPSTIDEYIEAEAPSAQPLLRQLRDTLKEAVPDAEESIKWSQPAFSLKHILFMFTAYKNFVSFAPTPAGPEKSVLPTLARPPASIWQSHHAVMRFRLSLE